MVYIAPLNTIRVKRNHDLASICSKWVKTTRLKLYYTTTLEQINIKEGLLIRFQSMHISWFLNQMVTYLGLRSHKIGRVSVLTSLWVKSVFFLNFEMKLQVIFMTRAVSKRDICFMKAVLLQFEHEHFSQNFASHGLSCPTPPPPPLNTFRVN